MKKELNKEETETVLNALNEAVEKGPWHSSKFLSIIGKKIEAIRDNFVAKISRPEDDKNPLEKITQRMSQQQVEQQEVYVAIYSSTGSTLSSWEQILNNLSRYIISRPVYENETDVKERLRGSANPEKEAYVVILINKNTIIELPAKKMRRDRSDRPLLALKEHAVTVGNIIRFEHVSGTYQFANGRLIKKASE